MVIQKLFRYPVRSDNYGRCFEMINMACEFA